MKTTNFDQIKNLSLDIKKTYEQINIKDGHKKWQVEDYTMGMIGDCGDLCKLIMAKNKLRRTKSEDLDQDIEHELVDILWSLIIIADQLDIDLEEAAITQLNKLKTNVEKVALSKQNLT
jgi:NTP pyrophosphatase (non-canonical NTP hydrolase)